MKKSQNSRNQSFSYYFCLMIEGSGSVSGSVYLTNGSRFWIREAQKHMGPTDPDPQHFVALKDEFLRTVHLYSPFEICNIIS
jgi:hypothetical protein